MFRHPNISAWVREEDGSYKSELLGLTLVVSWRPESRERSVPRGFSWQVENSERKLSESAAVNEEIEAAMAEAEDAARQAAATPSEAPTA